MRMKLRSNNEQTILNIIASPKEIVSIGELESINRLQGNGFFVPEVSRTGFLKRYSITYTGPKCITLSEYLKTGLSKRDFMNIIAQVVLATKKMDGRHLSLKHLLLNPRYIFVDTAENKLFFIYIPTISGNSNADMLRFISRIIQETSYNCRESLKYVADLEDFLNQQSAYSVTDISEYLSQQDAGAAKILSEDNCSERAFITDKPGEYYDYCNRLKNGESNIDQIPDAEETTVLRDDSAMDLFQKSSSPEYAYPYLIRISTGEKISANKPVFRIGKDPLSVNYCVINNGAVSRKHADIITRGDRYYILDHNSTNGTYVNEKMISSDIETEIYSGSTIRLGNEEFRLYAD